MNQIDGLLILTFLPLALLLCGYWLAALLSDNTAADRLAFAVLFGLALLLAAVAAVNFQRPLAGVWAYACLVVGLPSLLPRNLTALWQDIREVLRGRPGGVALVLAGYLILLLWPVMKDPGSLFYDGTSNHDSFFWVAGAEHLKRHTYFELPGHTPTQPLLGTASAIVGWNPAWGRMGAEGLLALASSVIGVSPIKLYLYATACLYFAWLAGAWLALKTFVTANPGRPAALALAGLQPVFAFFYGNSNLPNLLGALTGAAFVIAFERALRSRRAGRPESDGYLVLAALAFHGLLCAYPEMTPFVLLPAGLLCLRHWWQAGFRAGWWPCVLAGGSILLGVALNVATTIRAFHGFLESFGMARADENWANLFSPLGLAEHVPGLVSLSVPAARQLGPWLGWPLTFVLLAAALLVVLRARDRLGLLAVFSGSAALLLYTLVTGFAYGWQKTVQFSGVLVGMVFPAAVVHALVAALGESGRLNRWLARLSLAAVPVFLAFATAMNFRETYKWSDRKVISADWFALRDASRTTLRQAPVLVEAASFPMAFFHGMWSAYFLTDSRLYFGARGEQNGGYLRGGVAQEGRFDIPAPAAYLVGRAWADTFDANSPRLLSGREYALLGRANRVLDLSGVFPLNGVPEVASARLALELAPAVASRLQFTLTPRPGQTTRDASWEIRRQAAGVEAYTATVSGPPPWRFAVPLLARQRQTLRIECTPGSESGDEKYPFALSDLRVVSVPLPLAPDAGIIDFVRDRTWEDYLPEGLRALPGGDGVVAAPQEAVLQFVAARAEADVALELVARPQYAAGTPPTPLPTELWLNDSLVFTGFFTEPGVLRSRIFHEHWNQRPHAVIRLRFPGNPDGGPRLVLKTLTTRADTTPRP